MKRWWDRIPRSALFLVCCSMSLPACDGGTGDGEGSAESGSPATDSEGESESESATGMIPTDTEDTIGWFEIGWGDGSYVPVADGDPFPIVLGGQGAQMFPMPLRGGEFYLPDDPTSWMDETGPLVDLEMDIEGFNDGPGGHFKYIANYTLDWVVLDDGTYESSFLPIIVPDGVDADALDGLPAHLWVRLRPYEQPSLEVELDVVVEVLTPS